jgi:hypothetical protein
MLHDRLRTCLGYIGQALHDPEAFAVDWQEHGAPGAWWVFAALTLTAIAGTASYGLILGLTGGAGHMLRSSVCLTVAAGIAWGLPLPALYILNSLTGSRLTPGTTFLAALVTTSWGGLALIASIPISLFFTTALPYPVVVLLTNLVVFSGVGLSMVDVFGRVMAQLEPQRGRAPAVWLVLVGAIGAELFYYFGLFSFLAA